MRKKSKPNKKTEKTGKTNPIQVPEKGNVFDKILKENILEIRRPFAEEFLGRKIKSLKPLPSKMQTTLEIESDDFSLVEYVDGEKEILHFEFEIKLTNKMIYRVGEYHAVHQRKHELPIRHFVFHIGIGKHEVRTQLPPTEVYTGFTLIRANDKPPEEYLASDFPAVVIMAILGDYQEELKDRVIRSILTRLHELVGSERELNKYIQQLFMFGRIRKLQPEIKKNVEIMKSFNYDITQDEFYLEGAAMAEAKARENDISGIKELLKDGLYSQKRISEILKVPISLVRKVKKEMDTEN